jgi:hypothetical protein
MIVTPLHGVLVLDVMKDHARLVVVMDSLGSSILLPVLLTRHMKSSRCDQPQPAPLTYSNDKAADCH